MMKTLIKVWTILILSTVGLMAAGPPFAPILRNSVTTNSFPKVNPAANDALIWDGVNNRWTNGAVSANATNALSDLNGSSSNHQFIVIWTATETSNTFGIQTAQGAGGGTNFFHFPTADATHSGVLSSNDWIAFNNIVATNFNANQFTVSSKIVSISSGARITNSLLEGNTVVGTNGWFQIGDGANKTIVTNFNLLRQTGGLLVPVGSITSSNMSDFYEDANLTINGLATINGATIQGTLHVQGTLSSFDQDLTVTGPLTANGTVSLNGGSGAGVSLSGLTASRALVLNSAKNITNAAGTPDGTKFLRDDNTYAVPPLTGALTNIVNDSTNWPAGQVGLLGPTNNGDVRIKSLSAGANITLTDQGTNISIAATAGGAGNPGGLDMQVQFNQGGSTFAGTNDLFFDRTNTVLTIGKGAEAAPHIAIVETSHELDIFSTRIVEAATASLYFGVAAKTNWFIDATTLPTSFAPVVDVTSDLGEPTLRIRTNWTSALDTSNAVFRAARYDIPQAPASGKGPGATNLLVDGLSGNVWTNYNIAAGLTNIYVTNLQDHQTIKIVLFVATGSSVGFPQFTSTNYLSGLVETIDTNVVSEILIYRSGTYTNLTTLSRQLVLAPSGPITMTTNFTTGIITINSTGGAGVVQWQTNNVIVNAGQTNFNLFVYDMSMFATNNTASNKVDYALYGKTNFNIATLGFAFVTNQLEYIPAEYNGSNGVTGTALTNNWDMTLNTFKAVTNFVGTNLTFTISNVVRGESLISSFIDLGGYSNTLTFLATAGINIKWMNWTTNGTYDVQVRPGYTYTLQMFADRSTNVIAWMSTDDPYVPITVVNFNAFNAGISNLVATNAAVQAGASTSNATVIGDLFTTTIPIANAGAAATNLASYAVPANTLTNANDTLRVFDSGAMKTTTAGTNQIQVIYGSQTILDTGFQTASNGWWQIQGYISASALTAGFTNQYCSFKLEWWGKGVTGIPFAITNVNIWLTQTNGIANTLKITTTSDINGGVTNESFRVRYEPASR